MIGWFVNNETQKDIEEMSPDLFKEEPGLLPALLMKTIRPQ
jgi:hypothetical protein